MSLRVEGVHGNIHGDERLRRLHEKLLPLGAVEKVCLSRKDAARNRIRVLSDKAREVLIDVPRGLTIKHGDVLSYDDSGMVVAEWTPEETLIITIAPGRDWRDQVEVGSRLGYILGMKHLPLFVSRNEILVPIEESREDFTKMFAALPGISTRVEKRILEESPAIAGYEHVH